LVLMTRQYDFIWGSTILDQAAFQQLTAYLSFPMDVIHWPTPSVDEVIASQQGLNEMSSTVRSSWAYFLLGCLLFLINANAWSVVSLLTTLTITGAVN